MGKENSEVQALKEEITLYKKLAEKYEQLFEEYKSLYEENKKKDNVQTIEYKFVGTPGKVERAEDIPFIPYNRPEIYKGRPDSKWPEFPIVPGLPQGPGWPIVEDEIGGKIISSSSNIERLN